MTGDLFDRERDRFGSASFAQSEDVRSAGLLKRQGAFFGYWKSEPMFLAGDAPLITVSGRGGSKTSAIAIAATLHWAHQPAVINDPKGQIGAVVQPALAKAGTRAFYCNAFGVGGNPQHSGNPYGFVKLNSPYVHADCAFFSKAAIPSSGSANAKYFEESAQQIYASLMKFDLERRVGTSPPSIARMINLMDSGSPWADLLEGMLASRFDDVRRTASDLLYKAAEAPKEYSAIKSELVLHTAYLNDPRVAASLEGDDYSIAEILDDSRNTHLYINSPAEHLVYLAAATRAYFSAIMLLKARSPHTRRVLLLVDEAPALGSFPALEQAVVYGRGAGIRCWTFWQSIGQISKFHGESAVQTFLGSSQLRQFMSVRDFETAQLVSNMIGAETLEWDDKLAQSDARRQRHHAAMSALLGADPFEAAANMAHYSRASSNRMKQRRQLLTPDEVLAIPEDRQIAFVSGKNLSPMIAWKLPYYARRELAGLYLADPHHPPTDSVQIMTAFGARRAKVIRGAVPRHCAHLPQYKSGEAAWVDGFPL
jgi:type IV secretion system protein VirD4